MYIIDRLTVPRTLILALCFFLVSVTVYAQLDKENKRKLQKVEKLYKKKNYKDAAILTREVINDFPVNENLWKLYNQVMYANYVSSKILSPVKLSVESTESKNSEYIENNLKYTLGKPRYDYQNAIYYSATCLPYNIKSSALLRTMYVDHKYYTGAEVLAESKELFDIGEKEFETKNYQNAIRFYQQAYDADTGNFKALLYMGDCYFALEYYGQAAVYFRRAIQKQPFLNEPLKYLINVLYKKGEYQKALEVAKNSLLVYPEEAVILQIYNLLNEQNSDKTLNRNWVLRLAPANTLEDTNYRNSFFEELLHFDHYVAAKNGAEAHYDATGIRKPNAAPELEQYLEIKSWKDMLKATKNENIPALDYARKMNAQGMLAPYVFISLFNVDFYTQYRHFIDHNRELALEYINTFLLTPKS